MFDGNIDILCFHASGYLAVNVYNFQCIQMLMCMER